jgi:BASS family bile acid:Na+ symporter
MVRASRWIVISDVVHFLLRHLVGALMLGVGLAARPREFAQIWQQRSLYARELLVMELAVPLLAIATVAVLRLPPLVGALILLMAICPGAVFVPVATKEKGEQYSPIGLNLLVLVSLLMPVTVPLWVWVIGELSHFELGITPADVLGKVVPSVFAPLLVGLAVRHVFPKGADALARVAHYFFLIALAVAIAGALYVGAPLLFHAPLSALLAVLVVVVGAALMGWWAGGPQLETRRASGLAAALGNPGLVLAIVAVSYPDFRAAALIAAYLLFRKLALVPFELWTMRHGPPGTGLSRA